MFKDLYYYIIGWRPITELPPDELLEIMDGDGNTAKAYPTYYPFKITKKSHYGKWKVDVEPCDPYWDGCWLIQSHLLERPNINKIVRWKKIKN